MPVTQVFSRIELSAPSASFDAISIWNMGLKIDVASADRLHVQREEPARLVDPGKCLIFHFSGIRRRLKGRDALHDMLSVPFSLCTRYHLKPKQELYIFNMFGSTMEPENYIRETVLIPLDES
jgi:hypothetical protein